MKENGPLGDMQVSDHLPHTLGLTCCDFRSMEMNLYKFLNSFPRKYTYVEQLLDFSTLTNVTL